MDSINGRKSVPYYNTGFICLFYLRRTENWSEEKEAMIERLGEMTKGRRERIEKGSRVRIEKERKERMRKRQKGVEKTI